MAVEEGLRRLPRTSVVSLGQASVVSLGQALTNQTLEWGRIRQKKATFSRLPPTSTTASPKSTWGMARRAMQRHEGFARRLPPGPNMVLHDGVAAGKPVLVA